MKVYAYTKRVVIVGKGWEVIQKLKEYSNHYLYVSDWIESNSNK